MHIIRILRDYIGITQKELALRAGISAADLSDMESGMGGVIIAIVRIVLITNAIEMILYLCKRELAFAVNHSSLLNCLFK